MYKKNFSELLKEIRLQLAISQEELARLLDVSFATVNRWENAHSAPSKMARKAISVFCTLQVEAGKLKLSKESYE